ncbi:rhodanese-like domain-containing protein [Lentilactobacillus laojiaonis]|uniref:rhodanese-like domain-containing protein n=1 Tax=Lentilactobacillus laojiaonis TaxID=2883998 RepID=UPI001D0A96FE|nr:rhodanese-like domain-containing protein [Lentilactobacillus laojiaonis]UDM32620.1 rhodanese-like domain-containing protein [Lentilactobacillus laojiaonis]
MGAITTNTGLATVLILILIFWIGYRLYENARINRMATYLTNDEFKAGMRKAQVVDLREKSNFNAGHILGARNIPYSTMRTFYQQIRPDLPVYLYDQGKTLSKRATKLLNKQGYDKIYILKGGYQNWDGKEKKN